MSVKQARNLRRNLTDAERRLWSRLRRRDLMRFYFRRQVPLGPYVVDFVCKRQRVVVELDVGQHSSRKDYDARRTKHLNRMGYEVLRFWNNDVLKNMDGVLESILTALHARDR